jgi:hypothetical protein
MTASIDPTGMVNNTPRRAIFQWGRSQLQTRPIHRLFMGKMDGKNRWVATEIMANRYPEPDLGENHWAFPLVFVSR